MVQLRGFEVAGKKSELICNYASLTPKQYYRKFDAFINEIGLKRCRVNFYCYRRKSNQSIAFYVILVIYVDDMLLASLSMKEINLLNGQLSKRIETKDFEAAKQTRIGMRIVRKNGCLKLNQRKYSEKILKILNCSTLRKSNFPLGVGSEVMSKLQSPKTWEG